MTPQQLFQAGQLDEAIQALSAEVRDNPQDVKRRTFLFELLCFSGDLSRAEKHLDLAAQGSQQAEMGALLYHAALHAERTRRDLLWLPAKVRTSDKFEERELGEILLPVLTPFASQHPDPAVRLGRETVWEETSEGEQVPAGQKILLADDKEWPLLELRSIHIAIAQMAS